MTTGWYELGTSGEGQYRFLLKAGNGETILSSELYKTKASARNGIASVRANCATDDRYERRVATNGKPYFNLRASNHQVIGTSQLYGSDAARDTGIASVKVNGLADVIKEMA